MSEELFAKIYVDEGMPKILAKQLRKKGSDIVRAEELGNTCLSDAEQLNIALNLGRVLLSDDKCTFIKDSRALEIDHCGIIILTRQVSKQDAVLIAEEVDKKFLNRYAKDEWKNLIVHL